MIFITGYPRSGTTFFSNNLARIKNVFVGPETQYYRIFDKKRKINKDEVIKNLVKDNRLNDYNLVSSDYETILESTRNDHKDLLSQILYFCSLKAGFKKPVLVEKSPAHILYFKKILMDYPNAKFIFVIKDPRDVVESNLKVKWIHSNIYRHCVTWNIYTEQYIYLASIFPNAVTLVKFEDLVMHNQECISNVCKFLDIEYVLETCVKIETVPDWELEWKSESLAEPNISKIFRWKKSTNTQALNACNMICDKYIKMFSYESQSRSPDLKVWIMSTIYNNWFYKNYLKLKWKVYK
jgi:hypothetical protein